MTELEQIRHAVSASSSTDDRETSALYLAVARSRLAAVTRELAELERLVTAREVEIGRRSRDVTQLALVEREP